MNDDFRVIDDDQIENTWNIESMERAKQRKEEERKGKEETSLEIKVKEARYRCEQLNISRINGETITFHSDIKTQYLFKIIPTLLQMRIKLEDYAFSVSPNYFQDGIDFSKQIETSIKNEITLSYDKQAKITDIHNIGELQNKWEKFRDVDIPQLKLYKELKSKAPEHAQDIIDSGNLEYHSPKELAAVIDKNLFYHIMLRVNVGDELQKYTLVQYSQLFPKLELTTNVEKIKVKETNTLINYKLHGELDRSNINDGELRKLYDKYYKSIIKYAYTEFSYFYIINYSMEKETGLLFDAKVSLCEKIKNNFEAITEFVIRRIEL